MEEDVVKKFKWAVVLVVVALLGTFMLTACQPGETKKEKFTVTYYDGTTVLKTESVQGGVRPLFGNRQPKTEWNLLLGTLTAV